LLDKRGGHGWSDGYNIRLAGTQFPIGVHAIALPGAVWTGGVEPNIWYHLAVVQDSDSLKMYFNGLLAHSAENQYAANTRAPLRIGEFLGYPDAYLGLRGSIDELRIWNHPRSQNEIVAAMHEKLSGNEQGLAAYWDFDELVDGAVADLSPNSNDAILHGQASLIPSEVGMVPPLPDTLSEALDTALSFTTGGNANWFAQTTTSQYGGDAAQSGGISHNQESWMQTTVSGAGTVSFYWKVSSGAGYDFLEFYIDGSLEDQIRGSVNWQQKTYTISTLDSHTLEWRYVKDRGMDSGSDCGWVDKLEWVSTPGPAPLPLAFNPDPADGVVLADTNVILSWESGFGAILHYFYFGDDYDVVYNATGGLLQATTTYSPGTLDLEKTYYWRVDEVQADGTIHTGDVWSFSILPEISITGPSLVGWWKFDGRSRNIAYDSSGHGNDGILVGNPQRVAGKIGGALKFDGNGDYIDCGYDSNLNITNEVAVTAWIKLSATGIDQKVGSNQSGIAGGYKMTVFSNNKVEFEIRTSGNTPILNRNVGGGTVLQRDVWYHVAGVYSQKGNYIRTYVDGNFDRELVTTQALGASPEPFRIGCEPFATGLYNFNGVMDDVRIYNRTLTEAEIQVIMQGEEFPYAFNPDPADGAKYVDTNVELSWSQGDGAQLHFVYFGDNFDDVNKDPGGILLETTTYTPGTLELGKVYYWRVDEFDGVVIHKGDVWSFTVADPLSEALDSGSNTLE
jgi:hypothetical protein